MALLSLYIVIRFLFCSNFIVWNYVEKMTRYEHYVIGELKTGKINPSIFWPMAIQKCELHRRKTSKRTKTAAMLASTWTQFILFFIFPWKEILTFIIIQNTSFDTPHSTRDLSKYFWYLTCPMNFLLSSVAESHFSRFSKNQLRDVIHSLVTSL
jgi:hypothetical protein